MKKNLSLKIFTVLLVISFLVSCSAEQPAETTAVEDSTQSPQASILNLNADTVSSSGEVVPEKWVNLSFPISGKNLQILVSVGDDVEAGQILAQLDDTEAQSRLIQAQQTVSEMTSPESVAIAKLAISTLDSDVYNYQLSYDNTVNWKSADRIKDYNAEYVIAQDNLTKAQDNYNNARRTDSINTAEEAYAYNSLYDAQVEFDKAQFNLDTYSQKPSQRLIDEAAAKLDLVKAKLTNAQNYLLAITGGEVPADASGNALFQFRQAQRSLLEAEEALEDTKLYSPFSGSIVEINGNNGEGFTPGKPLIVMADFNTLQVLTKDMSEIDTGRVKLGDAAKVTFDALPTVEVTGRVVKIALKNSSGSGVYYTVTIALDTIPEDLRWGMNAFAVISVE
jgi:HlyD family secretion protein